MLSHFAHFITSMLDFQKARSLSSLTSSLLCHVDTISAPLDIMLVLIAPWIVSSTTAARFTAFFGDCAEQNEARLCAFLMKHESSE